MKNKEGAASKFSFPLFSLLRRKGRGGSSVILRQRLLFTFILLSATNRSMEFAGIHLPFISSYMDDVLCIPIVLGIMLIIFRKYITYETYTFPLLYILFTVALYSFVFEYYLPMHSHRFTSDKWDVVAYGVGALFFLLFMNGRKPGYPAYS